MKNANIRHYAELAVKNGKVKTKSDLALKIVKIAYCLAIAAAIAVCLSLAIGNLVMMDYYKLDNDTADKIALYNEQRNQLYTMLISVASLVTCLFLLRFKLCIPMAVVSCVDAVVIFTTLYDASVNRPNDFYNEGLRSFLIMAIPALLVAGLGIALAVLLLVFYKSRVPKMYEKIVNDLYMANTKNGEIQMSPEEFDEVMDKYDGGEIFRTDRPLKKSQRRRKEKGEEKSKDTSDK